MSRRKQEKPQPRKNIVKGETDLAPDILTCGVCRKNFPLAEIVRFIQHKVQMCNKENNCLELVYEDSEEDSSPPILVPKKEEQEETPVKEEQVSSSSIIQMALTAKDTSANTNENSQGEPRSYVCSTCKQSLSSAWALIQHVQGAHGLSICAESAPDEPPRAPLLERQVEPLALFAREPPSSVTPPPLLEPPKISSLQDSSYSQRLRVLAGATSPRKPLQPGLGATLNSCRTSPPEPVPSPAAGDLSAKGRLCEYCGKSFQFKSNLIVHRRSHTGEKPFKCKRCDHACTQASKLRRHMKTHRRTRQNGRANGDCDEDAEDEEEEELNVDGVEDEEEDGDCLRENGNLVIDHEDMVAEDLSKKPPSNGRPRSVISEIMEKIGLGRIPPFDEAYQQALRESSARHSDASSNDGGSRHSYDTHRLAPERPPREGSRSAGQSPLGLGDTPESGKRVRLDESRDADGHLLYAGVWFPRVEPPPQQPQYRDLFGSDAGSPSEGGRPGPGPLVAGGKSSGGREGPRRNDTCEYCGKVFKNCSNLTVHRRSHTGEKPYKCELCSYACAQSSKLTRHMKTHGRLGRDVFRCRFCDMPFSVASTLEKHMRKCVVSQGGGSASPYLASEDSKEMAAA